MNGILQVRNYHVNSIDILIGPFHDFICSDDHALLEEDHIDPFEEDVVVVPTLTSKKKSRGGNYSVLEDEASVSAWENVSLDLVTGKDVPRTSYW